MCVKVIASQRWDVFLETRCKIQWFFVLVIFLIFLFLVPCVGFRAHTNIVLSYSSLFSGVDVLQEIKLTTNVSLAAALNQTFTDCDNATDSLDCAHPPSFLRHPVGALATFDHAFTAPGRYWVTVFAARMDPETNTSDTVTSNVSVVVSLTPALVDETGLVLLLAANYTYVDEPLTLIILIQNRVADVTVTADCESDHSEQRPMIVVEAATKTTLADAIESAPDEYRNRYRVAARSRPRSSNADEVATLMYYRRDAVDGFHRAVGGGRRRITVTVRRTCAPDACGEGDRITLGTAVEVRQRPSLVDELGTVTVTARQPAYVNETVEFVYTVQRPRPQLEYRLDFGDRSTLPVNSTIHRLPGWLNNSGLHARLPGGLRELLNIYQSTCAIKARYTLAVSMARGHGCHF